MGELNEKDWVKNSIISIAEDDMEAYIMLWPSADEEKATAEEIIMLLHEKNIKMGILEDEIDKMLSEKKYLEDVLVAKGVPEVVGVDGEFEFFVEIKRERKPIILDDGSVDYSNYNAVTLVKKDELLCRYIPSKRGSDGYNIKGVVLTGKKGQELHGIKGKGFYVSEDGLEYYSSIDGRVEYANNYMVVSHDLRVDGNVDRLYGNIDFIGDVEIKGDVVANMTIKASGFLTVEGHVESAHLIAGKGVILKNGMQGSGTGLIECQGDVEGKYFEQTTIRCLGDLHANAILSCDIKTGGSVNVEGTLGALVGGKTQAGTFVQAAYIGNMGNVKTEIVVGTEGNTEAELKKNQEELKAYTMDLYKTEGKIKLLEEALGKGLGEDTVNDMKKQLLRSKISLKSAMAERESRIKELYNAIEKAFYSKVTINSQVYPGTTVIVNGLFMKVPDVINNISIQIVDHNVVMVPNK